MTLLTLTLDRAAHNAPLLPAPLRPLRPRRAPLLDALKLVCGYGASLGIAQERQEESDFVVGPVDYVLQLTGRFFDQLLQLSSNDLVPVAIRPRAEKIIQIL